MKIIRARECRTTKIHDSEFSQYVLPKGYSRYFSLKIDEDGDLCIEAEAYAGIIPCKNDIAVQIDPKVNIADLTYLLLKGRELNRSLDTPFEETVPYQIAEDSLDSFFEALVSNFLSQLDIIKSLGLLRNVETRLEELRFIKGKPNLSQFRTTYPKSFGLRMNCWVRKCVFDNAPNRLLLYCLKHLVGANLITLKQQEIFNRIGYFAAIERRPIETDDLEVVKDALEFRKIPSSRHYYIPALNLALLILQGAGITLGEKQEIEFKPLVIDTARMFESYVRTLVKEFLNDTQISVLNGREYSYFFYDQARNRLSLIPDIVLSRGGENLGLIDVKYKKSPTSSDHYQIWVYMSAYDTNRAMFVSVTESKETRIDQFKKDSRIVYDYEFSLTNIRRSEEDLFHFLKNEFIQT